MRPPVMTDCRQMGSDRNRSKMPLEISVFRATPVYTVMNATVWTRMPGMANSAYALVQGPRHPLGVRDGRRERDRVGVAVHLDAEGPREQLLPVGPLLCVAHPYMQCARADRGLELTAGALGDDRSAVDDRNPVG